MRVSRLALVAFAYSLAAEWLWPQLSPQEAPQRFEELDRKAQVEFRRREFGKAAAEFRQASRIGPEGLSSYYDLLAVAASKVAARNFGQAREALERADQLRPDSALPLVMLVKVSLMAGDAEDARKRLRAAAQRFPADGRLHGELAQDLAQEKRYDLALAEALRFERSGLKDPEATLTLAALENEIGAYADAIRHAVAIEADSKLPDSVRASAAAAIARGYDGLTQTEEAISHLKLAIRLAPAQEDFYLALQRLYELQQNHAAAIEILEQGRKHISGSPNVWLALAASLELAKDDAAARQVLGELIEKFPDHLDAYPLLADAYRHAGEFALATETLRKLARHKPDYVILPDYEMVHVAIAESMLAENPVNHQGVLDELAKAEKISPADYELCYLRGKVYVLLGKYKEAITTLRRAVDLRPVEPTAYYQLGLAYYRSGQAELAKEMMDRMQYVKSQFMVP